MNKHTDISPLDFALMMEKFQSVKWLAENGAELNAKGHPGFLSAVRYCSDELIRLLVSHGAKVNTVNNAGSDAFPEAYYGIAKERCMELYRSLFDMNKEDVDPNHNEFVGAGHIKMAYLQGLRLE